MLYVGKAQSLRARVRSYFNRGGDGRHQVPFLVDRVADVEVIATANVKEALLLENQLIKKHKPRFNVRLRDDKQYLALRLDPTRDLPALHRDAQVRARRRALLRPVHVEHRAARHARLAAADLPAAHLQRSRVPRATSAAAGRASSTRSTAARRRAAGGSPTRRTQTLVNGAILLLRGKADDLLRELRAQMAAAAEAERFEEAGRLRDRLRAIERTSSARRWSRASSSTATRSGSRATAPRLAVQVLHVRQGKIAGSSAHEFKDVAGDDPETLGSYLAQYYGEEREIPREVLLPFAVEAVGDLAELLRERAGPRGRGRASRSAASAASWSSWRCATPSSRSSSSTSARRAPRSCSRP